MPGGGVLTTDGNTTSWTKTLTNLTLITPTIASITNGAATLSLPTTSDTLVGRTTIDTLTNKSLSGSSNTFTNIPNTALTNNAITINGQPTALGSSATITTTGTLNRISVTNGGTLTPTIDIANTYIGQASITTVGALSSGSIASGFGAINIGTNTLTSGLINGQTISSAANFTGSLTTAGIGTFTVAANNQALFTRDGTDGIFIRGNNTATNYNWIAASNLNTVDAFEITPSTLAGGSIFSTPALTILRTGNVGIGTTTPLEQLSIVAGTAPKVAFGVYTDTAGRGIRLATPDYNGTTTGSDLRISMGAGSGNTYTSFQGFTAGESTANGNLVFNPSGGNVGIGTTTPNANYQLDIAKSNSTAYASTTEPVELLDLFNTATGITGLTSGMRFQTRANDQTGQAATIAAVSTTGGYSPSLVFQSQTGATTYAERMRIDSSGNLGIGLTTVHSQVTIGGSAAQTTAALTDAGTRAGLLEILGAGGTAGNGGGIVLGVDTVGSGAGYGQTAIKSLLTSGAGNGTADLAFSTRNATTDTALTERMRITSAGNVGIGTTNPTNTSLALNRVVDISGSTATGISFHPSGTTQEGSIGSGSAGDGLLISSAGAATATGNVIRFLTTATNSSYTPSERMRVDASGNVGIGTTTPSTTLHIAAPGAASPKIRLEDTTSTGYMELYEGSNSYITSKNGLYFGTNATLASTMTLLPSGNVGIGTTTPTYLLDVESANPVVKIAATTGTNGAIALFNNTGGTSEIGQQNSAATNIIASGGQPYYFAIAAPQSDTYGGIQFATGLAASAKMTIAPNGNVGIGTTNPFTSLQVLSNNTYSSGIFLSPGTSGLSGLNLWYDNSAFTTSYFDSRYDSAGAAMSFRMRAAGTPVTAMTILGSGNVGIGTTSPTGQLSINNQVYNAAPLTYAGSSSVTGQNTLNGYYSNSDGLYSRYLDIVSVGSPDGTNGGSNIRFLTNPVTLNASAVERMRIDKNGNVGIGTTNPGNLLTVASTNTGGINVSVNAASTNVTSGVGAPLTISNTNATAGNYSAIVFYDANGHIQGSMGMMNGAHTANAQGTFYIEPRIVATPSAFVVNPSGNVGIGTTSPTEKLHLGFSGQETTVKVGTYARFGNSGGATEAVIADMVANSVYTAPAWTADNATYGGYLFREDAAGGRFSFYTAPAGATHTYSERFSILNNGNVGIGTTTPADALDVKGPGIVRFGGTNTGYGSTIELDANVYGGGGKNWQLMSSGSTNGTIGGSKFAIRDTSVAGADSNTYRFLIDTSGNVGIGTTPSSWGTTQWKALEMAGGASFLGRIDVTGGAYINNNVYHDGTNWKVLTSATRQGSVLETTGGIFNFYSFPAAAVGTAVTPANTMTITAAGNLGISALAAGTANSLCYNTTILTGLNTFSTCSSDQRLKQNITPLPDDTLSKLMQLNPVSYNWNPSFATDQTLQFGVIAQQVAQVFPNLVSKTAPTPLTPDGTYSVNFNGLYGPIIKSIQTMNLRVQAIPLETDQSLYAKIADFLRGIAERGEAVIDYIRAKQVTGDQLCAGTTCVNQTQLQYMINYINNHPDTTSAPVSAPTATPAPTSTTPTTTTPTTTSPTVAAPTPTAPAPTTSTLTTASPTL